MIDWAVERMGEVTSTMDVARRRAADGCPEGTVIVADAQSAGRGRRGRTWHSPAGAGLWCTAVLRPRGDRVETLGLVAGAAVLEALHDIGADGVRLKWPNDILVGRRKLCGILLQAEGSASAPSILLGIGLNLRAAGDLDLPRDIRDRTIGLDELIPACPADDVLAAVLAAVDQHYGSWFHSGLGPSLETWRRFDGLAGERVTADGPAGPVTGIADGIADDGALRLLVGGSIVEIRAGEIRGEVHTGNVR